MPGLVMKSSADNSLAFEAMGTDDIASRIEVMRMQEEAGYRCGDYLYQEQSTTFDRHPTRPQQEIGRMCAKRVDEECRVKMSEWCYQVVDFCKFNRETVAIAMSYLDRFLMTKSAGQYIENRKSFQLAAMTALYMAIKLFEPEVMEPKIVAGLSRGSYTEQEITDMEMDMLNALEWRVQPPTAFSFVQHFLALLPAEVSACVRQTVLEYSQYQAEIAVNNYYFVKVNPSTVAVASIINAMDMVSHVYLPASTRWLFLRTMTQVASIDVLSTQTKGAREVLLSMLSQSYGCGLSDSFIHASEAVSSLKHEQKSSGNASPRCVSRNSDIIIQTEHPCGAGGFV